MPPLNPDLLSSCRIEDVELRVSEAAGVFGGGDYSESLRFHAMQECLS
jgi:hypothetical protein